MTIRAQWQAGPALQADANFAGSPSVPADLDFPARDRRGRLAWKLLLRRWPSAGIALLAAVALFGAP